MTETMGGKTVDKGALLAALRDKLHHANGPIQGKFFI